MQRQRGGLVPIDDALADLDGSVKAVRDASPQASRKTVELRGIQAEQHETSFS